VLRHDSELSRIHPYVPVLIHSDRDYATAGLERALARSESACPADLADAPPRPGHWISREAASFFAMRTSRELIAGLWPAVVSHGNSPKRSRKEPRNGLPPRGSLAGSTNRVDGGRDQPYFMYPFLGLGPKAGWSITVKGRLARSRAAFRTWRSSARRAPAFSPRPRGGYVEARPEDAAPSSYPRSRSVRSQIRPEPVGTRLRPPTRRTGVSGRTSLGGQPSRW
jgi:hypothetical protein